MRIYKTVDGGFVALVSHDMDLYRKDEDWGYFGLFEYAVVQVEDTGEWILSIYDIGEDEPLDPEELDGVSSEAVQHLLECATGEREYEEVKGSDYFTRAAAFEQVLHDEVLRSALVAYLDNMREDGWL